MKKTIVVASNNPVKIEATKKAFEALFPKDELTFTGINAPSDVPDQPVGEAQTKQGSINRVRNAKTIDPHADFYVGIEGGVVDYGATMVECCWVTIENKQGAQSSANSGGFQVPHEMAHMVREGKELGPAGDIFFNIDNMKQTLGLIGILTDGVVDRTTYIYNALLFALLPFKKPELYDTKIPTKQLEATINQ